MEPKPGEVTPMSGERLDAIERRNYAHQPIQPIDVDDLVKEITRLRSERDALEYARVCWLLKSKEVETLRDQIHSREVETSERTPTVIGCSGTKRLTNGPVFDDRPAV